MNGSDLLDKLENLDPALVASAAEPAAPRARRGPDWGTWAAAAACVLAICLPLALTYLIRGVTPTVEYGPGAKGGGASHQASPGEDGPEGGSGLGTDRQPNKGTGDGPTASYSTLPEPQENIAGYKDYITWTKYTLNETYCSAFPDGLPAEEYFKYNKQEPESMDNIRSPYDSGGSHILSDFESYPLIGTAEAAAGTSETPAESMVVYAQRILSGLSRHPQPISGFFKCTPDGSGLYLARISTATQPYYDVDDAYLRSSWNISVLICQEPLLSEKDLAEGKYESDETVVIPSEGGGPITALGGLNTNRVLMCTLPNGMWCRIAGNFNVPCEDMVNIMNALLKSTSSLDIIDEGLADGTLVTVSTDEYLGPLGVSPSASPDPWNDLIKSLDPHQTE